MVKQKIAFVIPSLGAGGAERVVSTLANNMVNDYEVCIITFISATPFYHLNNKIQLIHCVDEINPSANPFIALKSNYKLLRRINSIVKEEKITLLIGFLTSANVLTVLASKFNKIPSIISERVNPFVAKTPKIWQILRKITYPKANFLTVQTNEIRNFYIPSVKKERLVVLPNPISEDLTNTRKINSEKENIILNVGRLTNQKAQDILIKAFSNSDNQNWKLIIIGEGPKRNEYEAFIKKLNLSDKVIIKGKTKNISEYYNSAKIFAFTSIYEGFPNALIEAMHFGLPCISTDCPSGPSELIKDGINGYLIPMNNEEVLSLKLNDLMKSENARLTFGNNAVKSVERFKVGNVIKQWIEIIQFSLNNKNV